MQMKRFLSLGIVIALSAMAVAADENTAKQSKAKDRVQAAADVLNEIQSAPDQGIPAEVLGSAECVAVVPSMLKGGFVVGAHYGRGLASCRTPKGWSAPAFFSVKGGSFGLQIGGQASPLSSLTSGMQAAPRLSLRAVLRQSQRVAGRSPMRTASPMASASHSRSRSTIYVGSSARQIYPSRSILKAAMATLRKWSARLSLWRSTREPWAATWRTAFRRTENSAK